MPTDHPLSPSQQSHIAGLLLHGQAYLEVQLTAQEQFGHRPSTATIIELARTSAISPQLAAPAPSTSPAFWPTTPPPRA